MIKEKTLWEEFYYNDVESTLTQYSEEQLEQIKRTFNIPISTKLAFPIVEQMLAFLTASKPEPKLIAPTESMKEFAIYSEQGFQGIWYESKVGRELKDALRDKLTIGSGWLHVRTNDFYNESTFNVVVERVDWRKVFIDPECEKMDLSDADYVFIAEVMRKERAEKKYDIKIRPSDQADNNLTFYTDVGDLFNNAYLDYFSLPFDNEAMNKKEEFVLVRRCYLREETNVYISEEGDISLKKPVTIEVFNPKYIELQEQIKEVEDQIKMLSIQSGEIATESTKQIGAGAMKYEIGEDGGEHFEAGGKLNPEMEEITEDFKALTNKYNEMNMQLSQIPFSIPAYEFYLGYKDKNGEPVTKTVYEVQRIRKKIFKHLVLVGDRLVEEVVLPSSMNYYPLIHLGFQKKGFTYKTSGIIHQISDIEKAYNKTISLILLDMSINSNRKVLYWRGTVAEPSQVESSFAQPGSWTELIADPSLPNAGQPIIIEPSPLNQSFMALFQLFSSLIESTTGMAGILKGVQPNIQSQSSMSNSLASQENELGTSRMKLYGRTLEDELEILSHVVISYLYNYAPKDKQLLYYDGRNKEQYLEVPTATLTEDLQFKVRVNIVSSMPTIRNLAADALGKIAQTAGDPAIASLLVQYYLKLIDLPQSEEWIEQLDMIKKANSEIQQLQEALKKKDSDLRNIENNLVQTRIAKEVAEKKHKAETSIATEQARTEESIGNIEERAEEMANPGEANMEQANEEELINSNIF